MTSPADKKAILRFGKKFAATVRGALGQNTKSLEDVFTIDGGSRLGVAIDKKIAAEAAAAEQERKEAAALVCARQEQEERDVQSALAKLTPAELAALAARSQARKSLTGSNLG